MSNLRTIPDGWRVLKTILRLSVQRVSKASKAALEDSQSVAGSMAANLGASPTTSYPAE